MSGKFIIRKVFPHEDSRWEWIFRSGARRLACSYETYKSKKSCRAAVKGFVRKLGSSYPYTRVEILDGESSSKTLSIY